LNEQVGLKTADHHRTQQTTTDHRRTHRGPPQQTAGRTADHCKTGWEAVKQQI